MNLHGYFADEERSCNFPICLALGEESIDFLFSLGKAVGPILGYDRDW
jgi:hypothetical protein